jgi:hypothetical protein
LFSQQFYALQARLLAMMTNRRCRTRSKFAPRPTNGRALPRWHSLQSVCGLVTILCTFTSLARRRAAHDVHARVLWVL